MAGPLFAAAEYSFQWTHTAIYFDEKTQRTDREVPARCAVCCSLRPLSNVCHQVSHGLCCLGLLLPLGVDVCAEGGTTAS